jgi:hypothetical protein
MLDTLGVHGLPDGLRPPAADYDGADIASPTYEYQDEHDTEPGAPTKDEALYDVTEGYGKASSS